MGVDGVPISLVKENDSVVFTILELIGPDNLRAFVLDDLQKQILVGFDPYAVKKSKACRFRRLTAPLTEEKIKNLFFVTMTEYSKALSSSGAVVAFPPATVQVSWED